LPPNRSEGICANPEAEAVSGRAGSAAPGADRSGARRTRLGRGSWTSCAAWRIGTRRSATCTASAWWSGSRSCAKRSN